MPVIDIVIFAAYMICLIFIGLYFYKAKESEEDYYLAGRNMGSLHIGLSVVATDVGGGFSIGLGGLGFVMGLAGSWMLFTGLLGAWLSAVFLIPVVKPRSSQFRFITFPDLFRHHYGPATALLAGIISAVGYLGFTSSQILAGAKLATAALPIVNMQNALLAIGVIVVAYTVLGGIKAVVYTDTIQWIILMTGLIGVGIPVAYYAIGGMDAIRASISPSFLDITHISWVQLVNWAVTIVPIWFIAMTLYQRIYATRSVRDARKAWIIAGVFEWPLMAFMGVILGMFSRVAVDQGMFVSLGYASAAGMDPEMGLPLLLREVLPVGFTGLMLAAYFSAIMSTADSCLLASSGNILSDILGRIGVNPLSTSFASRLVTLVAGTVAVLIALRMTNVLDLMLYSYAFMVSGLFVPVVAILTGYGKNERAAFWSMLLGGSTTVTLAVLVSLEVVSLPLDLDANVFGILCSAAAFALIYAIAERKR